MNCDDAANECDDAVTIAEYRYWNDPLALIDLERH